MTPKQPFGARCIKCGHTWTAAFLPMEMATFARLVGALHCPACGADSKDLRHGSAVETPEVSS
jgi:Zn finger protein HypA/HybF involved in hydrogenase expression